MKLPCLALPSAFVSPLRRLAQTRSSPPSSSAQKRGLALMSEGEGVRATRRLGFSDMMVTPVCLGTMTWGEQNSEDEAHAQLDYAIKERGVNFIDTAEMYPVPTAQHTQGLTEKYLGTWLAKNQDWRHKIYIATKVAGFMADSYMVAGRLKENGYLAINGKQKGPARHDPESIHRACRASLARMQTSYIDLYQLHWPDRYVPKFGSTVYDPAQHYPTAVPFEIICRAIKELLDEGLIRSWGLSNETPFGVAQFAAAAHRVGIPKPVSIQNSFSLVHREFEQTLAESCAHWNYNLSLLPWSPLAGGALSGKYLEGQKPEGARMTIWPFFQSRWLNPRCVSAIERYKALADAEGMSLTTLSLAWINSRNYMENGSTIIGATKMDQLKECIDAFEEGVTLSERTLEAIDEVHLDCRDPSQFI
ncbi:unnamed protein product [Vitrella brassicaformis CCMP3155]|uniref:NADP-dependent oxidoreductase domain-containing protein n=3 Tax=Vitrella brassicaformis TaxID=1169539 RepID=A0A0G4G8Q3_VITBC|nr:unnamed protein product [Vitrella brassicaformis CCMP3155]|eukprot:CEM25087.1 unnamed protein product [Vitrella brassicaformis CCMP3155]